MIISIIIFIFNILLLIFPEKVLIASREGLLLWFNNVLPSLLPFIIAANMLIALGFSQYLGRVLSPLMRVFFNLPGAGGFALVTGLTSGYPMGAKTVADLRRAGLLTAKEGQHLMAFCNNAGPLFIIGVVGVGLFESAVTGYVLWGTHVISALMLGFLLREKKTAEVRLCSRHFSEVNSEVNATNLPPLRINLKPIGTILSESVKNAMESILLIGGLIIFFSVFIAVIEQIIQPDNFYGGILAGTAEVTGGLRRLAVLEKTPVTLGAAAFILAFGGLSIHAQTFHFAADTGIRVFPYIKSKVLHGVIAAWLTMLYYVLR